MPKDLPFTLQPMTLFQIFCLTIIKPYPVSKDPFRQEINVSGRSHKGTQFFDRGFQLYEALHSNIDLFSLAEKKKKYYGVPAFVIFPATSARKCYKIMLYVVLVLSK